jgi:hypothetical protein
MDTSRPQALSTAWAMLALIYAGQVHILLYVILKILFIKVL